MTDNLQSDDSTVALEVACDTEVSGCVFRMRTEEDDRDRLLQITREHVEQQHDREITLDEIDERHVDVVEVETGMEHA